jgi:hypothetical protein
MHVSMQTTLYLGTYILYSPENSILIPPESVCRQEEQVTSIAPFHDFFSTPLPLYHSNKISPHICCRRSAEVTTTVESPRSRAHTTGAKPALRHACSIPAVFTHNLHGRMHCIVPSALQTTRPCLATTTKRPAALLLPSSL